MENIIEIPTFFSVLFINKQTRTELSVMCGREKDILFTLLGFLL